MRPCLALVACPLLLLITACQGPDLSAEITEHAGLLNAQIEFACDCPEDVGYASYTECVAALGDVDDSDEQCMADALADEGAAGKEYMDCLNAAFREEGSCLLASADCPPGRYDSCAGPRTTATQACMQVSSEVQIQFSLCSSL